MNKHRFNALSNLDGVIKAAVQMQAASVPSTLPLDLISKIIWEHMGIWNLTAAQLYGLSSASRDFCVLLRPYIYRHVNLRTLPDACRYFGTVCQPQNCHLAMSAQTLQISFSTSPSTSEPEGSLLFWSDLRAALSVLQNLQTLNLCYSREDGAFLDRYMEEGDIGNLLPTTVHTLHMKPLANEDASENEHSMAMAQAHTGPWQSNTWRLHLSRIPHISTLIVSTPTYMFWPATRDYLEEKLLEWTAQMRRPGQNTPSVLSTIILNYGYGDGGLSLFPPDDEDDDDEEPDDLDIFQPREVMDSEVGIQVLWTKSDKGTRSDTGRWKIQFIRSPSSSDRREYLFGCTRKDHLKGWLHLDEKRLGKLWRRSQEDIIKRRKRAGAMSKASLVVSY
ncbi:hypothetical protein C8R45DRAFT_1211450 [Mycena sanguinolenta]|nr:hypothetical protein C8R45DRAFT_1211450 [Mycena sanguinolenta]